MRAAAVLVILFTPLASTGSGDALDAWLDAHPKLDDDWRDRYAWQGGGAHVHLIVNVDDDFDLGTWADLRGHLSYRLAQSVSAYLLALPFSELPALLTHPGTTFVEFDHPLEYHLATSSVDTQARMPGGLGGMWQAGSDGFAAPMGLSRPLTGKGVTVAVLDTGLDETHPDFGGYDCSTDAASTTCQSRVATKVHVEHFPYFAALGGLLPTLGVGDVLPTSDTEGHGTHTAGTVAGNGRIAREFGNPADGGDGLTIGIAPEASIVSVGIGVGPHAGLADAAIGWVVDHREAYDISVTSNSYGCALGCTYSPGSARTEMMKALYDDGVVSVWSVGNQGGSGSGGEMSGYAQIPWVLGVAAYDDRIDELAYFSSRGAKSAQLVDPRNWTPDDEGEGPPRRPDIAAPGVAVQAARDMLGGRPPLGNVAANAYVSKSGTSMAAPHVAGAMALYAEACPSASPLDRMRAALVGADPAAIAKTMRPHSDTTGADPTGAKPWSLGPGVAEPFEAGYGALRIRPGLDYLMEGCRDGDLRTQVNVAEPGDTVALAMQFEQTVIDAPVPDVADVRGLPRGMAWNPDMNALLGAAWDEGQYNVAFASGAQTHWMRLLVLGSSMSFIDPGQGLVGYADAFGLQRLALPTVEGHAFLSGPATLTAHLALCQTECDVPGVGIPVGFVRGTGPDGLPVELRLQQSVPVAPEVRTIELAPGVVTFTIEAGMYAGGARMWATSPGTFGYEPAPRLELPAAVHVAAGGALRHVLEWGVAGEARLVEAPAGVELVDGVLLGSLAPGLHEVWLEARDEATVVEQGVRIAVAPAAPPDQPAATSSGTAPPPATQPGVSTGSASPQPADTGFAHDAPAVDRGSPNVPGLLAVAVALVLLRRR